MYFIFPACISVVKHLVPIILTNYIEYSHIPNIFIFGNYCYIIYALLFSNLATERRWSMDALSTFFVSVMASIVAYYICKWLDDDD